jgi:hypothetical protein
VPHHPVYGSGAMMVHGSTDSSVGAQRHCTGNYKNDLKTKA